MGEYRCSGRVNSSRSISGTRIEVFETLWQKIINRPWGTSPSRSPFQDSTLHNLGTQSIPRIHLDLRHLLMPAICWCMGTAVNCRLRAWCTRIVTRQNEQLIQVSFHLAAGSQLLWSLCCLTDRCGPQMVRKYKKTHTKTRI